MAEKYTKLYESGGSLYCPGAPVIVTEAALFRDNKSRECFARLSFMNISRETVSSLIVDLTPLDSDGEQIGEPVEYSYEELSALRDAEFGKDAQIPFTEPDVSSFSLTVMSVDYANGEYWICPPDGGWDTLPPGRSLAEALGDEELAVQYQTRYGGDCAWAIWESGGLWGCVCGAVNSSDEAKCHRCRRSIAALKTVNLNTLREEAEKRVKVEQVQEAADREETDRRSARNRKLFLLAAFIVPMLILAGGLMVTIPKVNAVRDAYNAGLAYLDSGSYDEAEAVFTALGDYRDSPQQVQWNIPYRRTLHLLELAEEGDDSYIALIGKTSDQLPREEYGAYAASALLYQAAEENFAALDGYRDSDEQIVFCQEAVAECRRRKLQDDYDAAVELLSEGDYSRAAAAFLDLGDFEDSADMAKECLYQKGLALYGFTEKYKVRYIYASISSEPEGMSSFRMLRSRAGNLGQECISDLRAACGKDGADIALSDDDCGMKNMAEELSGFFTALGGYKDSAQYAEELLISMDYTREFFQLLSDGDISGARDWLNGYDEEFEDREGWFALLDTYSAFCGGWRFNTGDPTLIPFSCGVTGEALSVTCKAAVADGSALLRLSFDCGDGTEHTADLSAEKGKAMFSTNDGSGRYYYCSLGNNGHLIYMLYDAGGTLKGSADYVRSEA